MCTAISFNSGGHYFGRTLDLYYSLNERVAITPREYTFKMRFLNEIKNHYAIIGMACIKNNYPLYYDATNEMGLSVAGLNFPQNACYLTPTHNKINLAPFELIPYLLCQYKDVNEVKKAVKNLCLVDIPFADDMPNTPLHFMVSDKQKSIVLEPTENGLMVYDNPVGVLTNSPPFKTQMTSLLNYAGLTNKNPDSLTFGADLKPFSLGLGAVGLPGDLSSTSRFVRAVFTKHFAVKEGTEGRSVEQFFNILRAVSVVKGVALANQNTPQFTRYTSCCNTQKGIYYYTTHLNSRINAVNIFNENLNAQNLITYPINKEFDIKLQN